MTPWPAAVLSDREIEMTAEVATLADAAGQAGAWLDPVREGIDEFPGTWLSLVEHSPGVPGVGRSKSAG